MVLRRSTNTSDGDDWLPWAQTSQTLGLVIDGLRQGAWPCRRQKWEGMQPSISGMEVGTSDEPVLVETPRGRGACLGRRDDRWWLVGLVK